jgi:hypothetical protein
MQAANWLIRTAELKIAMSNVLQLRSLRSVASLCFSCQLMVVSCTLVRECPAQQTFAAPEFAPSEALPAPEPPVKAERPPLEGCDVKLVNPTLGELTVDTRPRIAGNVVPPEDLPSDCASAVFTGQTYMNINVACGCGRPDYFGVLRLARYCHRPLYFNDDCLERCGVRSCWCQPGASALRFYGTALLMPLELCSQCPCSCVPARTCY